MPPTELGWELLSRKACLGRCLSCQGTDGNGLLQLREVAKHGAVLLEELEAGHHIRWQALHGSVVRVLWLEYLREMLPHDLNQRQEGDAIERHGQGVTLGDSLLAQEDERILSWAPADEANLMAIVN